jgi:CubicO group peptidase (beta-lactamase class C family)
MTRAFLLALLASASLASGVLAQGLAADTHAATPAGATLTEPKDWTVETGAKSIVLTAPEGDARLAIVDVGAATDAKAAVEAAWTVFHPAGHPPFKLAEPLAPRDGWEERTLVQYETSPNEHRVVQALADRRGAAWTVLIADGSEGTLEKRAGAAGLVLGSLRPAGYQRESFAGMTAHPLDAARVEALKDFVRASMQELGVPGVGLALIDHGKVVYEGGLGVKALGKPDPVDAHTLFMIASNTKGMSTLLLARLVDAGKLKWDEPVTQVYPDFKLGSADTTRQVLMRHLVCACTGLPRKDFNWIFDTNPKTPASDTFVELAATQPTSKFGEVFQYNNLMASAAGYIGGHLVHPDMELGHAYDLAMREQIFAPLGMDESTFDMAKALASDHASPHGDDIDGKPRLANMAFNYVVEPARPAGGEWSSVHDVIRYVELELTQGVLPNGQRLVSAESLLARRKPSVPVGEDAFYGMGLMTDATWGVTVVHHGGSLAGFKSDWAAIPDAQVGAVLLTNSDEGQDLLRPFQRRLLEVLFDGKPLAAAMVAAAAKDNQLEIAKERQRLVVPAGPDAAGKLAAHYVSADLGQIAVRRVGGRTVFDFGVWKSEVASRKNDDGTTSFVTIDPTNAGFTFVVTDKDGRRGLTIRDGQHEYHYTAG